MVQNDPFRMQVTNRVIFRQIWFKESVLLSIQEIQEWVDKKDFLILKKLSCNKRMYHFTLKEVKLSTRIIKGKGFSQKKQGLQTVLNIWTIEQLQSRPNLKFTRRCLTKLNINLKKRFIIVMPFSFWSSNLNNLRERKKSQNTQRFWRCWGVTSCTDVNNAERDTKAWLSTRNIWHNILSKNFKQEKRGNISPCCWTLINGLIKGPVAVYNNSISFILALEI